MKTTLSLALCFLTAACCFQAGSAPKQRNGKAEYEQYIRKYQSLAIENMKRYGIPASITMAQALIESGCGNSTLAVRANNHFGIKCKSNWTGDFILHDDDQAGECFRKYKCVEDSYADHSEFLRTSPRYQSLFRLDPAEDYERWALGLKEAGYATNPQYAAQLIKVIEDYDLHSLDRKVAIGEEKPKKVRIEPQPVQEVVELLSDGLSEDYDAPKVQSGSYVATGSRGGRQVYRNNGVGFVVAQAGDSFASLARTLRMTEKQLLAYNDLRRSQRMEPDQIVYIAKKKKKAGNGYQTYAVEKGDSLYRIAQRFGISLPALCKRNYMSPDYRVSPGQRIRLR